MRKFSVITTFNKEGFDICAREMLASFDKFWSEDIILNVYYEDMNVPEIKTSDRISFFSFNEEVNKWYKFQSNFFLRELNKPDNSVNSFYKYSAIKFAHKIYAIEKQLEKNISEYLIWLDSDVITFKSITNSFIETLIEKDSYLTFLGREHINFHSEAGFLIFNTKNKFHKIFWERMMEMYDQGKLFDQNEWHDSYIFDVVRLELEKNLLKNINISLMGLNKSNDQLNVFDNSVLGQFMKHFKGNRKLKIKL
jgi:hypothetical protein